MRIVYGYQTSAFSNPQWIHKLTKTASTQIYIP